jgi:hypothetical protein
VRVKIDAKYRRFIIAGFGLIAILALLYVLFGQRLNIENYVDTLDEKKITLSKSLGTINLEGPLEVQLDQYKTRLEQNSGRLLEGDNANVAASELVKILTDLAEKGGIEITQKIVQREVKMEDSLYKVSARIVTRCDSEKLVQFLADIRNYGRFLTVDEFTIQTRTSRTQTGTQMTPTLTVSGYVRIAEPAGKEESPNV